MCKPCEEKWRIILAQQSNFQIMRDDKKVKQAEQLKASHIESNGKLDVEKLIAERRAKVESGKIIKK